MEFINTIWSALTTQNQGLINIIMVPCTIIEAILLMLLFTTFLNLKSTSKQRVLYVVAISTTAIISNLIIANEYKVILNAILYFICIKYIFKTSFMQTLLAEFLPILFQALFEYIVTKIFYEVFGFDSQIIYIPILRLALSFSIYSLMFLLYIIIKKLRLNISTIKNVDYKNKTLLLFSTILGIASISIQSLLTYYYNDKLPIVMTLINWIVLIAYLFINIFSIINVTKLQTKSEELENAELYNRTLSILHDSIRGFKHDFNNMVSTMGGFIYNDDMEGLKNYYTQLQSDCIKVNNLAVLNPNIINNPGVYSLLTDKYYKARELNIDINLDFFLDLNELKMSIYEFTRILGILLDNAIEEAKDCEEKVINISFRKFSNKHCQIISIENTYNNKDVNIDRIFDKGISGKDNHSGLGLWKVRQILKKHNNLNLFTTKNEKFFKQQLEIYY